MGWMYPCRLYVYDPRAAESMQAEARGRAPPDGFPVMTREALVIQDPHVGSTGINIHGGPAQERQPRPWAPVQGSDNNVPEDDEYRNDDNHQPQETPSRHSTRYHGPARRG
jgi:hypothetical protein